MMNLDQSVYEYVVSTIKALLDRKVVLLGVSEWNPLFDARRITYSIQVIRDYGLYKGVVVEVGSPNYLASRVIWSYFPDVNPIFTNHDLRFEPFPLNSESVDALIALEVIEHISDWPYQQATTLNGLFYFLEECFRILRPGGYGFFHHTKCHFFVGHIKSLIRAAADVLRMAFPRIYAFRDCRYF